MASRSWRRSKTPTVCATILMACLGLPRALSCGDDPFYVVYWQDNEVRGRHVGTALLVKIGAPALMRMPGSQETSRSHSCKRHLQFSLRSEPSTQVLIAPLSVMSAETSRSSPTCRLVSAADGASSLE